MSRSRYSVDWIGEIPPTWSVMPIGRIASAGGDVLPEHGNGVSLIRYVDISSVDHITGISGTSTIPFEEAPSRARRLAKSGDVVVSTVRTYLKAVAEVTNEFSDCVFSTGFAVLRANRAVLAPGFLKWAMLNENLIQAIESHSEGLSYPAINASELLKLKTVIPPLNEQQAIVAHLDRATARIDALAAKKVRFIELLRERRQALITHAVTSGLDEGVPMKNSGVEWIGKVPAHWSVVQSRRMFSERNQKAGNDEQQLTVSQKYGLIAQSEFMALEGRRVVQVQKGHEILKHVEPGDFVISMRSFQGGLELSRLSGSVSSAYVPLIPLKWVDHGYFRHLFKSSTYIQALQSTSDLVRDGQALRFENFSKVPLPVVPIDEQQTIASFLDRTTARIDALIAKTERSIELLREHRTALVTAAVTGKIDLRKAE